MRLTFLESSHHIHFPSLCPCDKAPGDDSHCPPSNCEPAPRISHAHQGNHATSCIACRVLKRPPCKSHPTFGNSLAQRKISLLQVIFERLNIINAFYHSSIIHHHAFALWKNHLKPWLLGHKSWKLFVQIALKALPSNHPTQPAWFSYPAKGH